MSRGDCQIWFSDQAPLVAELGYMNAGEQVDAEYVDLAPMELDRDPAAMPWHWQLHITDDDEHGIHQGIGGFAATQAEAINELALACSIELAGDWENLA